MALCEMKTLRYGTVSLLSLSWLNLPQITKFEKKTSLICNLFKEDFPDNVSLPNAEITTVYTRLLSLSLGRKFFTDKWKPA